MVVGILYRFGMMLLLFWYGLGMVLVGVVSLVGIEVAWFWYVFGMVLASF